MQQIVSRQIQSRCQRAWEFAPQELAKELRRLKVSQPNLVQLVTDECDFYGGPTRDFGVRVLYLVWCLLNERVERERNVVTPQHAIRVYERTIDVLFNLTGVNERFIERLLDPRTSGHPDLMQFIEDLMHEHRDADGAPLSNGELCVLFALGRSYIELLDHASRAPLHD